ncbi:MAG: arginine--tRNA ligase [Candidatus Saccharibacteria bacterium]
MYDVKTSLESAIQELFAVNIDAELNRPDLQFGDWSTNVAMQLAKIIGKNPHEIAQTIAEYMNQKSFSWLDRVEVAGPGFINIILKDDLFINMVNQINLQKELYGQLDIFKGQTIIVEYLDPNPFKEIHIGHAYTGTVGDAVASLFETAGGQVHRVTYQGDVGLHVAKAIYGILRRINNDVAGIDDIAVADRPIFLGKTYAEGANAYENDEQAKSEIIILNKKIYDQSDPLVNKIHEIGKSLSMDYFDDVYAKFEFTPFEKNYMERMVAEEGLKIVKENISDGIFKESDGAVIFEGEQYGLHTRVFINSQGLPTYESKDLGNAMLKWKDYAYDKSIIITGQEQAEYFKVMLKALEQFAKVQSERTTHIPHGMVKLNTGKMSSRSGQVVRALDLLETAEEAARSLAKSDNEPVRDITLAAIKYAFLKNRIGGDIVYDVDESLSLEGNSGPYLQYAHVRAHSIIEKANTKITEIKDLDAQERILADKLDEFPEIILSATTQLYPHIVCTYLFELAQSFNRFYEHNRIIGDARQAQRLALVNAYKTVLKNGLSILKIPVPNHM